MRIDLSSVVKDVYGQPVKEEDKEVCYYQLAIAALLNGPKDQLDGEQIVKIFNLAARIEAQRSSFTCSVTEAALIKERAVKVLPIPMVARLWLLIEAAAEQEKQEVKEAPSSAS